MSSRGYTLIEVVIALAIFAILGTLSAGLLSRALDIQSRISDNLTPISDLELVITRLTEDTHQIVNRKVRDSHMNLFSAFTGNTKQVAFTRGGYIPEKGTSNPSSLRRIALSCENHKLIRSTWPVLDGIDLEHPHLQVLLDNLNDCHFSMLYDGQWDDKFRESDIAPFPAALRLHIETKAHGQSTFIFVIPGGVSDTSKG